MAEPKSGIFKSVRFKGKRQHPGDPVRRPVRAFLPAFQHRLLSWTRRLPDDIASRDRFYLLSAWNMPNLAANVSSLWILCIRFARTSNYTIVLCSKSLEISRAANSLVSRRAERLSFLLLRFPLLFFLLLYNLLFLFPIRTRDYLLSQCFHYFFFHCLPLASFFFSTFSFYYFVFHDLQAAGYDDPLPHKCYFPNFNEICHW